MKRLVSALAFIATLAAGTSFAAEKSDFVGRWEISAKEFGQSAPNNQLNEGRLIIGLQDGQYKGTFNRLTFTGKLQADGLHLVCSGQSGSCGELVLTIANGMIAGKGTVAQMPVTISGQRPAVRPYNAPKLYNFEPKAFYPWFSNTIPPVLHIFPGDSVHTTTVDARGYDEHSALRSPSGNPETGPIYVEGAMPGDTLVVHLNRIRLNRATAFQNNSIASNALDPNYLRNAPKVSSTSNVWKLDSSAGTASLSNPSDRLKNFVVNLKPMLGCVGVAPPRDENLSSSHLGAFGGNMDFNEVREGNTLYLPVYQKGALLYFGDGHAEQGDGELTGQGLETSMDVQITVDVIENKSIGTPMVEDKDTIMIMGIGPSLDSAFKFATTGMAGWLADNYHLTSVEVAAVLGTSMQFEIAEVVDPEFNVVAKVRKDALNRIPKS